MYYQKSETKLVNDNNHCRACNTPRTGNPPEQLLSVNAVQPACVKKETLSGKTRAILNAAVLAAVLVSILICSLFSGCSHFSDKAAEKAVETFVNGLIYGDLNDLLSVTPEDYLLSYMDEFDYSRQELMSALEYAAQNISRVPTRVEYNFMNTSDFMADGEYYDTLYDQWVTIDGIKRDSRTAFILSSSYRDLKAIEVEVEADYDGTTISEVYTFLVGEKENKYYVLYPALPYLYLGG